MVSEEEAYRTVERGNWYAIRPMLPEVLAGDDAPQGFTSNTARHDDVMSPEQTRQLLVDRYLMLRDVSMPRAKCFDEGDDGTRDPSRDHPPEPRHRAARPHMSRTCSFTRDRITTTG